MIRGRSLASLAALLFTAGPACDQAKQSDAAIESELPLVEIAAAEDEPLVGHEFLRLTGVTPQMKLRRAEDERIEVALGNDGTYYVGMGSRIVVVDRASTESSVRVIELPFALELLGVRDDELVLFGSDRPYCPPSDRYYEDPSTPCMRVFRLAIAGAGPPQRIATFPAATRVVMVGDHVVALDGLSDLMTLSLSTGEVGAVAPLASHAKDEPAVQGDRVLWKAIELEGPTTERSVVLQSRAPFDDIEVVLQLERTLEAEAITDVAWVGEGIAYLVSEPRGSHDEEVKLYRRIGERTDLLLSGLPATATLINDEASAWLVDWRPNADRVQLWRIGPNEHRRVVSPATAEFVTAIPSGLAWIEERESTRSFHLAGAAPVELAVPEVDAEKPVALPVSPKSAQEDPQPTVDGALDTDIVRRIIHAHRNDVWICWERVARNQPDLAGELTVAFVIGKKGKVSATSVVGEPVDTALAKCMTKTIRGWTFPKPTDGKPVDVSYPFAFPLPKREPRLADP